MSLKKHKKKRKTLTGKHLHPGNEVLKAKLNDSFNFECKCCGECCRNVKDAVPIEILDVFAITKYLRDNGDPEITIESFLTNYAIPLNLLDCGFPTFFLQTKDSNHTCVFLEDSKCTIQQVKPKTCRLYPASVGPQENGNGLEYFLVSKKLFHYVGKRHTMQRWADSNFGKEYRLFTILEYELAPELGTQMIELKELGLGGSFDSIFLYYRYLNYDLDSEFIPQFVNNMKTLTKLAGYKLESAREVRKKNE